MHRAWIFRVRSKTTKGSSFHHHVELFKSDKPAELLCKPGLEYWFKERRTVSEFRRGPLGSHFDGFAACLAKQITVVVEPQFFLASAPNSMHSWLIAV